MLGIIIITLLLIGYQVTAADVDDSKNILTFSHRLRNSIEKKCLQNADSIKYNEVVKELDRLTDECFMFTIPPEGISDEDLSKKCFEHTKNVMKCLTKFGEKLEPCLKAEEAYLKQFIVDVYNSSSEYFCDHIKVLSELLRTNTAKCIMKFQEHPETDPHRVCYGNSTVFGDNPSVDIITKSELCIDLLHIDFCYDHVLMQYCSDAPEIQRFQRGLLIAGLQNCMDVLIHGTTEISEDATEPTDVKK